MPLLLVPLVLALLLVGLVALMPVSLVLRYRAGTARRLARGWVATLNVAMLTLSTAIFLATAAVTTIWVPRAFAAAVAGLAVGGLLGALGLRLSRWESTPQALYYTPNRWLILALMLAVTSRLFYGIWRSWHAWHARPEDMSWLAASGAAGSLAVGAVVLGYYLAYSFGIRWRLTHHARARSPLADGTTR